jgi:hypothetical protein
MDKTEIKRYVDEYLDQFINQAFSEKLFDRFCEYISRRLSQIETQNLREYKDFYEIVWEIQAGKLQFLDGSDVKDRLMKWFVELFPERETLVTPTCCFARRMYDPDCEDCGRCVVKEHCAPPGTFQAKKQKKSKTTKKKHLTLVK